MNDSTETSLPLNISIYNLRSSSPVPWSCQRVAPLSTGERKRRISSSGSVNGGLVGGTLPSFTTQRKKMVEPSGVLLHPPTAIRSVFVCVPVRDVSCASGTLTLLYHLPCQLSVCLLISVRSFHWKRDCGSLTYDLAPWPHLSFVTVVVNLLLSKLKIQNVTCLEICSSKWPLWLIINSVLLVYYLSK